MRRWKAEPTYRLTLPYPPTTTNHRWIVVNGVMHEKPFLRRYKEECGWIAKGVVASAKPLEGVLKGVYRLYRPRKRGDADGVVKGFQDAGNGILYCDDAQLVRLEIEMFDDKLLPRVEVEIYELEQEE